MLRFLITSIISILLPPSALAQTYEVAPFLGWQEGGAVSLAEEDTGLDGAPVFGVMLTMDRGAGRKADLVLSAQRTRAERVEPFEPPISADVTIAYAHMGGRYHWRPEDRVDPYVAVTAGGTWLELRDRSGVALSFAAGIGADVRITPRTAIRFDGRFYTTLGADRLDIGCAGAIDCVGFASGNALTQFTASTGIVFRF
ncbi:MAG TPA: hypothetical protein VMS98_15360 [Thermoanaerobaculia bacterium]|nr:hypothetical protein [Thermoanaerobaculia bacterium]